jgi:hypothetical protein
MADLGRYPSEVRYIADELAEYLKGYVRVAAFEFLEKNGAAGVTTTTEKEYEKALRLLGQTPSQRDKFFDRADPETAAILILRARYLGIMSSMAMEFSERFNDIRGRGYRQAAVAGAMHCQGVRMVPSMSVVLPGWPAKSADVLLEESRRHDGPPRLFGR